MFTVTVENAQELISTWVRVTTAIRASMRRGVALAASQGAAEARAKHLFKNRTGKLERSITSAVVGSRTPVGVSPKSIKFGSTTRLDPNDGAHFAVITATEKYASYVENGRGPVVAIRAKMLRFVIDGQVFFRKSVGPAKPFPFMSFAYLKAERVLIKEIERGVAQAQSILDR